MRELAARAWFAVSLAIGALLRSARYSTVRVVEGGEPRVRKRRAAYAPLLIVLGNPLLALMDTGVRVLPGREWAERERGLWQALHGATVRADADGMLEMPRLPGATLASLLQGADVNEPTRGRAIALAVRALAGLHARGFTHGDAMAANVLVDLEAGMARWLDFETVHDERRPMTWRRADDLRALLATILLRTAPERRTATARHVVDAYDDEEVARALVAAFTSASWRPLPLHLGQAALSFDAYREVAESLRSRLAP